MQTTLGVLSVLLLDGSASLSAPLRNMSVFGFVVPALVLEESVAAHPDEEEGVHRLGQPGAVPSRAAAKDSLERSLESNSSESGGLIGFGWGVLGGTVLGFGVGMLTAIPGDEGDAFSGLAYLVNAVIGALCGFFTGAIVGGVIGLAVDRTTQVSQGDR